MMAATDPDRYLDPAKYETYVSAYLGQGMTEDDARNNLQKRGFNIPPGEVETVSMTETSAAAEPMADTSAESTPELDNWMRLFTEPTATGGQPLADDADPLEAGLLDMRAERRGQPTTMEKRMMSPTGLASDFPTPKEMQAGALHWGRLSQKEDDSEKTETLVAAEDTKDAVLQKGEEAAVTQGTTGTEETITTTTETVDDPDARQVSLWQQDVGGTITNQVKKTIFDQASDFINELKTPEIGTEGGFYFFGDNKQDYELVRDTIDTEIDKYETNIQAIAAEQQKPPLEGANKWLAILGVALGAAGSALTGTPNEAMQMLEGFLDREQQKFLKSKEMRMKSADQQRLDLIRRRGELLQQFQNETQRVMQISQFQLQKTNALANIQSIQEQLEQKQIKNNRDYELKVSEMIKDLIVSENTLRASMGKKERERYVPTLELTDQDGNKVIYGGFSARSEKAAGALWDYYSIMANAEGIINDLEPLLERSIVEKLSPAAFSQTRTEILELTAELEKEFKNLAGFGANYAEREIMLNQATLPSIMNDSTINLLIGAKRAIGPFRRKINRAYTNKIKPHGGSSVNLPAQQSGSKKTRGYVRNPKT
jgi:hypothetical protein